MFIAKVIVMPKLEVLDPQGAAVERAVGVMGYDAISDIRVGKIIEMKVNTADKAAAEAMVHEMADKLLANPVIETYRFSLEGAAK
jgi:phosphoribosylformylglycinamidine synthase subunit PurS